MKIFSSVCLIFAFIAISACTTTPYTRFKSPNISGMISFAAEPAAGVTLLLSLDGSDTQCLKAKVKTISGANGEFSLSAVKERMSYTPLMTHYLDEWVLCAEHHDQRVMIYSDNRYGMGSVIEAVNLQCNFDASHMSQSACTKSR